MEPTDTTPTPENTPQTPTTPEPATAQPAAPISTGGAKKKIPLLAIIAAGVVLLGGSVAAGYYGVVVPNKPENLLKSAFVNTLKQKQATIEGNLDMQAADSNKEDAMPASNAKFKIAANDEKGTAQLETTLTISGVKVQGEVRYIDQTVYIKLGDLSTVKAFAAGFNPAIGPAIDKVQNQWIEIDKTLLKQAKADCAIDASMMSISDDDIKLLADAYDKNKFATIQSSSNDTVNGKSAKKFEIVVDNKKAEEYGKNFENLSFVKKLKECEATKSTAESLSNQKSDTKDGDKTSFTLWVDKSSKRLAKLEFKSDDKAAKEDNVKGSLSMTIGYDAVNVEKPSGAKPLMSLMAEFAPLLGGGTGGVLGTNTDNNPFGMGL